MLAQNTQQQYEDAYANRQLMDKYLKQNLAQQGLADSGIANLYAQQNNTNYMNQRADIAKTNMLAEQDLYDKYTQAVQKREDDIYDLAIGKIDKSLNNNGYLSDSSRIELEDYFKGLGLSEDRTGLLNQYMDMYKPTEEQRKIAEYAPYYDDEANRVADEISELLEINTNKLSKTNMSKAYEILENNRDVIGEENYKNIYEAIKDYAMTEDDIKLLEELERKELGAALEFQKQNDWYDGTDSYLENLWRYMTRNVGNKSATEAGKKARKQLEEFFNTAKRTITRK